MSEDWKEQVTMQIKQLELLKANLVAMTSKLATHLDSKDRDCFAQVYAQIETDIAKLQMDLEIDDILSQ